MKTLRTLGLHVVLSLIALTLCFMGGCHHKRPKPPLGPNDPQPFPGSR